MTKPVWIALGLSLAAVIAWGQEPSFRQRVELRRIDRDLTEAAQLANQGQWAEAAGYAQRGIEALHRLVETTPTTSASWAHAELAKAVELHRSLSTRVDGLPTLGDLESLAASTPATPATSVRENQPANLPPPRTPPASVSIGTSFARDIAPLLVAKCGRCHIDDNKGRISLATHDAIMNKPDLVHVGQPETSELVAVIESGDMPRGSLKVSAAELELLRSWIAAGAVCDDAQRSTPVTELAAANADNSRPAMEPSIAGNSLSPSAPSTTGDSMGLVSFSRQIAPVLIETCAACHLDGRQVRGGLNLATFTSLGRGGDSGTLFTAGAGNDSLLVQKLRGTAGGMQMPAGRAPLGEETIATVARWIDEGARFDGFSPTGNLRDVVARARAGDSSHEELRAEREQRAIANWNLVMGGKQPLIEHSEHFTLLGGDESTDLKNLSGLANNTLREVAKQLKVSTREPFVKGNIALYVFQTRYDFSEFGKMIEQREIPRETYLHWGNTTLDAYLALQAKPADYPALEPALARSLVAIYYRGQAADVPNWFAEGYGVWIASRIFPDHPFVKEWETKSLQLLNQAPSKDDFLTGRLSAEDSALVASQFINFLKAHGGNEFQKFLKDLKTGEGFDRSFQVNFGASPQEIVQAAAPSQPTPDAGQGRQ